MLHWYERPGLNDAQLNTATICHAAKRCMHIEHTYILGINPLRMFCSISFTPSSYIVANRKLQVMLPISLPMHTTPASDIWLHDTVVVL